MLRYALIAATLALATPAPADAPNPQLAQLVERKVARYGIDIDGSQLTVAQAAQLHLLLTSERLSYVEGRRKIRAILRR